MTTPVIPADAMQIALLVDGGFTFDPRSGRFLRPTIDDVDGYAIAIPNTITTLADVASITVPDGAFIGGWIDDTDKVWLELAEVLDIPRADAIRIGHERGELAILDFATGEVIPTT